MRLMASHRLTHRMTGQPDSQRARKILESRIFP